MRKISVVICTFAFTVMIAPWGLFDYCARHSESHKHHGTCGDGMMDNSHEFDESTPKLIAARCQTFSIDTEDYALRDNKKLTSSQVLIIFILNKPVVWNPSADTETLIISEPGSTSDPPLRANSLRGPPSV